MKRRTVRGVDLAFVDRGAGTPLVLVHGFPLDHRMWNDQIDVLSTSCRVIAPDLRGFGQSAVSDGVVTMGAFADDLAGLLCELGIVDRVVLAGLSMGGYVALQFWRAYAERLQGLILCDTRAGADTVEGAAARWEMADRVLREGPDFLLDAMTPKLLAASTLENRPGVMQSLREVMLVTDPRGIAAASRGMAKRPDMSRQLQRINCPTLVIVGSEDVISPVEEMRGIADRLADARLVEIPEAGHMSPMENPAAVNAAIKEFVDALNY